jgi:hypothetical protein
MINDYFNSTSIFWFRFMVFNSPFNNISVISWQSTSLVVYNLLAHGRWFSPGTPASSTTKTGCHDIAEILLKVALNTKNQSNHRLPPHMEYNKDYNIYAK